MSLVGADGILGQKLRQRCHLGGRDAAVLQRGAGSLKVTCHLVDNEVGNHLCGFAGKALCRLLEERRRRGIAGDQLGVGALDAESTLKAIALGIGKLWQLGSAVLDELVRKVERS